MQWFFRSAIQLSLSINFWLKPLALCLPTRPLKGTAMNLQLFLSSLPTASADGRQDIKAGL
jgi:hypothetical protein